MKAPSPVILAALLLLAHGAPSGAQKQARWACRGKTTLQIEKCFSAQLDREDEKLRQVSARVRTSIDTSARVLMDSAGAAWARYRNAQCMSVYQSYAGGSLAGLQLLTCKVALTQERLRALGYLYSMQ
ncbi:MAG TPA: lysozyme inhibitor LprI family protein [Mycetocola sp.]|nr:lysozyme inhibitor LprI family protein [Mycetocola sp.]